MRWFCRMPRYVAMHGIPRWTRTRALELVCLPLWLVQITLPVRDSKSFQDRAAPVFWKLDFDVFQCYWLLKTARNRDFWNSFPRVFVSSFAKRNGYLLQLLQIHGHSFWFLQQLRSSVALFGSSHECRPCLPSSSTVFDRDEEYHSEKFFSMQCFSIWKRCLWCQGQMKQQVS